MYPVRYKRYSRKLITAILEFIDMSRLKDPVISFPITRDLAVLSFNLAFNKRD